MHRHDTEDKDSFIPLEDIVEIFANILANKKILPQWLGDLFKVHLRGKNGIREKGNWSERLQGTGHPSVVYPCKLSERFKVHSRLFFLIWSSSTSAVFERDNLLNCNGFKSW